MTDQTGSYWQQLFAEAWRLSRHLFAWRTPTVTFLAVLFFTSMFQGVESAAALVAPAVVSALAVVALASGTYVINLVRAIAVLHRREANRARTFQESNRQLSANLAAQRRELERAERRLENAGLTRDAQGKRKTSPTDCVHLANFIESYDRAINTATAKRFSEPARNRIDEHFKMIGTWLDKHVGPVQGQSFRSAAPVTLVYSGLPHAHVALWQVSQGRLAYLRELANRLCEGTTDG